MKLTYIQKQNLAKLDAVTSVAILHECVENLALYSVGGYHKLTGMNRRTIYDHIETGKLKTVTICEHLFIIINDNEL